MYRRTALESKRIAIRYFQLEALEKRNLLAALVVTNANDAGPSSFRQAIIDSNASIGVRDEITFSIGGGGQQVLQPNSTFPDIVDPVVINATTQPGFAGKPLIELDGSNAGDAPGLVLSSDDGEVRGLAIHSFRFSGIVIAGSNNLVAGNFIGTDHIMTHPSLK